MILSNIYNKIGQFWTVNNTAISKYMLYTNLTMTIVSSMIGCEEETAVAVANLVVIGSIKEEDKATVGSP